MKLVVSGLSNQEQLALADEADSWSDVAAVRGQTGGRDGAVAEALATVLVLTLLANLSLTIARVVKYIDDNFHKPVLVDLSGEEPRVVALLDAPGMRGRTFLKNADGQVELLNNVPAPQLAEEIKALMPGSAG